MKKILLATTLLGASAGMAAADVTISGYGRFGLQYTENRGSVAVIGLDEEEIDAGVFEARDTVISSRLRLNIDATKETDVGVTFGARLRIQSDSGDFDTSANTAQFTVAYEGLTVGVGNIDTAADSVKLTYASEMGFEDSSYGDSAGGFFAYRSKGSSLNRLISEGVGEFLDDVAYLDGYQGISATYSFGDINTYFSYVNPNQYAKGLDIEKEVGIAADWTNGQITVAGSYTANATGVKDYNHFFLGAAYAFGDATVGLNYYNFDYKSDSDSQVTLYGNYKFGDTTVRAYVSDLNTDEKTDVAYGLGADYSLGEGARISGSIQSGFDDDTSSADLGVRFDF